MSRTNIDQMASMHDWPQERVDRAMDEIAKQEQTEHFEASDTSHDGKQVEKLAATTQLAIGEFATRQGQDIDQGQLDEILKRAK